MFNLEDEDLTHFGQTLEDIKHFDGPIVSDDESGEEGTCCVNFEIMQILYPHLILTFSMACRLQG